MRRTFNDLASVANVQSIVAKSISGHLTDRMKAHYSTVSPVEQRESIGRVVRLVKPTPPAAGAVQTTSEGEGYSSTSKGTPTSGAAS